MEEKFEALREAVHKRFDELSHKLDTVYTTAVREKPVLRNVEAEPVYRDKKEDLKLRHQQQEEALKKENEEEEE